MGNKVSQNWVFKFKPSLKGIPPKLDLVSASDKSISNETETETETELSDVTPKISENSSSDDEEDDDEDETTPPPTTIQSTTNDSEDLRQVSRIEAETYAKECNLLFFEASAKTGENVGEIFTEIGMSFLSFQYEIRNW